MRVMIVERGQKTGEALAPALRAAGLYLDQFGLLSEAQEALRQGEFGALVLEERLPDGASLTWLKALRASGRSNPVILLIASGRGEDRAAALDAGADDCMTAPADPRELTARLRAVLRRPKALASTVIEAGNMKMDTATRELWVEQQLVSIPRRELSLIELLMRRFNRVVARSAFENELYGANDAVCPNSLEVRISRVRRHLTYAGANVTIQTVRGTGYILQAVDQKAKRFDIAPREAAAPFLPELRVAAAQA